MVSFIILYLACMPMGYRIGRDFQKYKASKYENTIDIETELNNYSFMPYMCALLLPMAILISLMLELSEL